MDSQFEEVKTLLLQNRVDCGADGVSGMGRCEDVNFKAACFFNKNKREGTEAHAWYDDTFENLNWNGNKLHIVGTFRATNGFWIGYDGTADQVKDQEEAVVLVFGESENDVLQKLNDKLGGNFNKQRKLREIK